MNKTLLIMAAGMGSRFGGLKQIEPIGPTGEFIIDYSIHDAIAEGFNKVVIIIKEENEKDFRETIGKRLEQQIKVEYVYQKNDDIPTGYKLPSSRIKPLGTAHAIYSARHNIKENFAVINADDFYGKDAYRVISKFLDTMTKENDKENYGIVGYQVINTLTENGKVKRGICEMENGYLKALTESSIEQKDKKIIAEPVDGSEKRILTEDKEVSMNMFAFSPSIFNYMEKDFKLFLEENKNNLDTCEYLITTVVTNMIEDNLINVNVLKTTSRWHGVTYKEDKIEVETAIKKLIEKGEYKENLWEE